MPPPSLEELTGRLAGMKIMPDVSRRVLDMVADGECTTPQLADAIGQDQALATQLLRVANSSFFGLSGTVSSLTVAVSVLGFRAIRDHVIAAGARGTYRRFGITEKMLWSHATASGIAARLVAEQVERGLRDDAFLCGLLHDLGKVAFVNECPDAYTEVMMAVYNEGLSSVAAERRVFGYTHTALGAVMSERWKFPGILTRSIACHHADEEEVPCASDARLARVMACVGVANDACKALGLGYRAPREDLRIEERPAWRALERPPGEAPELLQRIRATVAEEATLWQ
jgi:putative nucleotidyltransferase with HDIG domain